MNSYTAKSIQEASEVGTDNMDPNDSDDLEELPSGDEEEVTADVDDMIDLATADEVGTQLEDLILEWMPQAKMDESASLLVKLISMAKAYEGICNKLNDDPVVCIKRTELLTANVDCSLDGPYRNADDSGDGDDDDSDEHDLDEPDPCEGTGESDAGTGESGTEATDESGIDPDAAILFKEIEIAVDEYFPERDFRGLNRDAIADFAYDYVKTEHTPLEEFYDLCEQWEIGMEALEGIDKILAKYDFDEIHSGDTDDAKSNLRARLTLLCYQDLGYGTGGY